MDLTVTGPELHSVGTKRMSKAHGFILTVAFPSGTQHTNRTFALVIENVKSGSTGTVTGPGNGITVSSNLVKVFIPISNSLGGVSLSSLATGPCTFGFDTYSSTLYTSELIAGVRGDIQWVDSTGSFTDFIS